MDNDDDAETMQPFDSELDEDGDAETQPPVASAVTLHGALRAREANRHVRRCNGIVIFVVYMGLSLGRRLSLEQLSV